MRRTRLHESLGFFFKLLVILHTLSYTESQPYYYSTTENPLTSTLSTSSKLNNIDQWAVTKINVKKAKYSWTILNFNFNDKSSGQYMESPIFTMDEEYRWQLKVYPRNSNGYNDDSFMGVYITSMKVGETVPITYKFGFLNSDNIIYYPKNWKFAEIPPGYEEGYSNFISSNEVKKFLNDDKLTIIAEIAVNVGYTNTTGSCSSLSKDMSNYDHTENFENLLENEKFSDIQIKVQDYEIKAHRAILSSVSPVFNEEFIKLQKIGKSILEIDDVEPNLLKKVVHFAYTGKVEKIDKVAKDLLPIAKRFKIEQLERICEKSLCQNLNSNNAMGLLEIATSNNATYLKVQALKYITTHADSMIDTPTITTLISQPQILISVIRELINNSTI